ncbi:MAG: hypothetical protein HDQ87_09115 [Clostridia bacterium]|nr:hypothetical protein [Clostridia bacterium]
MSLRKEGVPRFVRDCFESGYVKIATGQLPGEATEARYFVLLKDLESTAVIDGEPVEFSMNLAIIFASEAEYARWMNGAKYDAKDMADALRDTIVIDRKDQFGYLIQSDKVAPLLRMRPDTMLQGAPSTAANKTVLFLNSDRTDLDALSAALGLKQNNETLELSRSGGLWATISSSSGMARKRGRGILLIAVIITVVLIIIFAVLAQPSNASSCEPSSTTLSQSVITQETARSGIGR